MINELIKMISNKAQSYDFILKHVKRKNIKIPQ